MEEKKKEITGATLKWIAIITMLIDHIGAAILEPYMGGEFGPMPTKVLGLNPMIWDFIIRGIGRVAFPIFIFLMVEGFFYTRNRKKYAIRLGLFCLISEIPFNLGFHPQDLEIYSDLPRLKFIDFDYTYQNVFFTLFIGFLTIWVMKVVSDYFAQRKMRLKPVGACTPEGVALDGIEDAEEESLDGETDSDREEKVSETASGFGAITAEVVCEKLLLGLVIFTGCALAHFLHTDYGFSGVLAILVCYIVKKRGGKYVGQMAAPVIVLSLMNMFEAIAFIDMALVVSYHGKKGKNIGKYFFYIFYPAHLLILGLIRWHLSGM